jgi:hypothetical protein
MERSRAFRADEPSDVTSAPEPMRRVTGTWASCAELDRAIEALVEARFPGDAIDVLMYDRAHGLTGVPVEQKTRVAAGATAGAAAGAALGLTLVTVFPGFALLVGGPLIGALNATVAGTIGGALNGLGWWRTEAEVPREALEAGGMLVGIEVPASRAEAAAAALRGAGATRVDVT